MAKLGNLYLDGKFPISTNRLNHFDRLFGQALFGGVEKSVDYAPIISINDALAKPAIDLQCKITAVQEGSGDPSPVNIRNIVGWNGLSLFRGGKNLIDNAFTKIGVRYYLGGYYENNPLVLPKGTYRLYYRDISGEKPNGLYVNPSIAQSYNSNVVVFTLTKETGVWFYAYFSDTAEHGTDYQSLTVGAQTTDYAPFTEITEYPVTWQTEAGTVYGGVVDLTTGGLTVTHVIYAFTGEEDIAYGTYLEHGRFFANVLTGQKSGTNVPLFCSHYKPSTAPVYANNADNNICANNAFLYWRDDSITSGADMETYLATQYANGTPVTVVYELATPQTYTLTPQAVQLLAGNNTLWCNTGDTKLTYLAKKS